VKLRHRAVAAIAVLYPLLLLCLAAAFRFIGERWWVTGVGLYLPRALFAAPLPFILVALAGMRLHRLLWTQVVAVLLIAFPLMGLVLPWPTLARSAPSVRVLSYNVNSGFGGARNVVDEIERYSPDIVLLQEVGPSEPIASMLREKYPTVDAVNQFILATRYPVLTVVDPNKIEYHGRSRSPRFVRQVLDTPLGHVVFYNVHPLSPREVFYALRGQGLRREILSGRLFSSSNTTVFQANAGLRALQVQDFAVASRRETDPVVVAGDTNLPGLSYVFACNLSAYQDGFEKAGWGFGYTFPTTRSPWMRIDRILASEQLRFVRFVTGSSRSSDHVAVVADLQR
jgi:endonuclease/exonuclease/phosphatase (EEP) superfamily protein YafD